MKASQLFYSTRITIQLNQINNIQETRSKQILKMENYTASAATMPVVCLVSLIATFIHFYHQQNLKYNLVLAATAEEEISGKNGIELLLKDESFLNITTTLKTPFRAGAGWCAIVGEPTLMNMAVAEKGLLVLDCTAHGKAGHAAREEGENAIYKAIKDIEWFRNYKFDKVSDLLGPNKMSVTIINAGSQHNVVPSQCNFTIDIRVNELYDFDEVINIIKQNIQSEVVPRSLRLRSTNIALDHPLVKAGLAFEQNILWLANNKR